jgi:hypothetical protein
VCARARACVCVCESLSVRARAALCRATECSAALPFVRRRTRSRIGAESRGLSCSPAPLSHALHSRQRSQPTRQRIGFGSLRRNGTALLYAAGRRRQLAPSTLRRTHDVPHSARAAVRSRTDVCVGTGIPVPAGVRRCARRRARGRPDGSANASAEAHLPCPLEARVPAAEAAAVRSPHARVSSRGGPRGERRRR